jgi:hypothetical protein
MIPVMTTTSARTLNQGLGLCVTSLAAGGGAAIASEAWSAAEILAMVFPVMNEAQPPVYRTVM